MERVNRIVTHPIWAKSVKEINEAERERIFCRHDTTHLLDVARLAYLENLEKHFSFAKEIIYAAALLHDVGRAAQYRDGIPHDQAGAEIAAHILADCGFGAEEQRQILAAITEHRSADTAIAQNLSGLIYRADKASRMCLFCPAQDQCNWSNEKKNLYLNG